MKINVKDVITWSAVATLMIFGIILWQKSKPTRTFNHVVKQHSADHNIIELPEIIFFAGERCPLEREDIAERFDREIHINKFWRSNTYLMLKRIHRWFPKIEKILRQHGIPEDLKYLAVAETMLQNLESPAGAAGFWQLMPSTAQDLGLEINDEVDERYDPIKATVAAAKYLKNAKERFHTWTDVVASYNRGMNGYERALEKQKVDHFYDLRLNSETSRYVFRVLALKEIIENPDKYGYKLNRKFRYPAVRTTSVMVDSSVTDLVEFAHNHGVTYKTLREHNPWIMDYSLTNTMRKKYHFLIPTEKDYNPKPKLDSTIKDSTLTDSVALLLKSRHGIGEQRGNYGVV